MLTVIIEHKFYNDIVGQRGRASLTRARSCVAMEAHGQESVEMLGESP